MTKKIYAAANSDGFQSWQGVISYDVDEAKNALINDYQRLTSSEKCKYDMFVEVYEIEAEDGISAEDALNDYIENSVCADIQDYINLTEFYITDASVVDIECDIWRIITEKSCSQKITSSYISLLVNDYISKYVNADYKYNEIYQDLINDCSDEDWFVEE